MDRGLVSSIKMTEYSVFCAERENPLILLVWHLRYLVNCNVLQTFVEAPPVLQQILVTFALPISH